MLLFSSGRCAVYLNTRFALGRKQVCRYGTRSQFCGSSADEKKKKKKENSL
jgi:hypothetical protein